MFAVPTAALQQGVGGGVGVQFGAIVVVRKIIIFYVYIVHDMYVYIVHVKIFSNYLQKCTYMYMTCIYHVHEFNYVKM